MPQISHRDIKEFKINPANFTDNQVLSYSSSAGKIINSIPFTQTSTPSTLAQRTINGCLKSADPVDNDDVTTKGYIATYLSSSLITALFKDSTTVDFTVDNNDGKVYASVLGQGSTPGSVQLKGATGYLAGSGILRQDLSNNVIIAEKGSVYSFTSRGLYTSTINKNVFLYPDVLLESISNNVSYGPNIQTHAFYNLNSNGSVVKRSVGSAIAGITQSIFALENYAAISDSVTQRAFAINVLSDSNWSTANRLCHFELFQAGATVTKVMASNTQGDILLGGAICVGNSLGTAIDGMIRWNGINIQGYNGANWLNLDSSVTQYDGVTITEDITWGLMVKDGGLTVPKFNNTALATGGLSNNDKLTTKGYVDAISSYSEHTITNATTFTLAHNKGRFVTPEVWIWDSVNSRYDMGFGDVYHSADKNTITINFSASYTGLVVLRG